MVQRLQVLLLLFYLLHAALLLLISCSLVDEVCILMRDVKPKLLVAVSNGISTRPCTLLTSIGRSCTYVLCRHLHHIFDAYPPLLASTLHRLIMHLARYLLHVYFCMDPMHSCHFDIQHGQ
jgi:hypothetical protein